MQTLDLRMTLSSANPRDFWVVLYLNAIIIDLVVVYLYSMPTLKQKTLQVFEIGRSLITDLKLKLTDYSKGNNGGDKQFMQGYTFNSGLEFLSQIESVIYNDENKKLLQGAPDESNDLQNIFTRIDQNNKHLFEIETNLNVFFKNLN
jgi:hypothetical protein